MTYSYDRHVPRTAAAPATLDLDNLSSGARTKLWRLDDSLVGTDDYMGVSYFWDEQYKWWLRDAPAKVRRKVHMAFRDARLPVDEASKEHLAILAEFFPDARRKLGSRLPHEVLEERVKAYLLSLRLPRRWRVKGGLEHGVLTFAYRFPNPYPDGKKYAPLFLEISAGQYPDDLEKLIEGQPTILRISYSRPIVEGGYEVTSSQDFRVQDIHDAIKEAHRLYDSEVKRRGGQW